MYNFKIGKQLASVVYKASSQNVSKLLFSDLKVVHRDSFISLYRHKRDLDVTSDNKLYI